MSNSRKALKVLSILAIIFAAMQILLGGLLFLGAGAGLMAGQVVETGTEVMDASSAAIYSGVSLVLVAVLSIVVGIFGLRAAKDPSKIGPYKVLAIIGLVIGIIQMLSFVISGQIASYGISGWLGLAMLVFCVILAFNISKENQAH